MYGKGHPASAGDLTAPGRVLLLITWLRQEQSHKCQFWQSAGVQGSCAAGVAELADSVLHLEVSGWDCFLLAGLHPLLSPAPVSTAMM